MVFNAKSELQQKRYELSIKLKRSLFCRTFFILNKREFKLHHIAMAYLIFVALLWSIAIYDGSSNKLIDLIINGLISILTVTLYYFSKHKSILFQKKIDKIKYTDEQITVIIDHLIQRDMKIATEGSKEDFEIHLKRLEERHG